MLDETAATSAQNAINQADKIIPTVKATEQARRAEMEKTIDLIEEKIPEVGPFAQVFGEKGTDGRFAVFTEPVVFARSEVYKAPEKTTFDVGLVYATPDGFKGYVLGGTELEVHKFRLKETISTMTDKGKKAGITPEYELRGGKPHIFAGGEFIQPLTDIVIEGPVVNAIKQSIVKAQEGPRKSISKDQQTTGIAAKAQATIAQATLRK